ncbi:hypothetical protein J7L13_00335, partial [bacterium]|nr:hypothetical protein [bacterium]
MRRKTLYWLIGLVLFLGFVTAGCLLFQSFVLRAENLLPSPPESRWEWKGNRLYHYYKGKKWVYYFIKEGILQPHARTITSQAGFLLRLSGKTARGAEIAYLFIWQKPNGETCIDHLLYKSSGRGKFDFIEKEETEKPRIILSGLDFLTSSRIRRFYSRWPELRDYLLDLSRMISSRPTVAPPPPSAEPVISTSSSAESSLETETTGSSSEEGPESSSKPWWRRAGRAVWDATVGALWRAIIRGIGSIIHFFLEALVKLCAVLIAS